MLTPFLPGAGECFSTEEVDLCKSLLSLRHHGSWISTACGDRCSLLCRTFNMIFFKIWLFLKWWNSNFTLEKWPKIFSFQNDQIRSTEGRDRLWPRERPSHTTQTPASAGQQSFSLQHSPPDPEFSSRCVCVCAFKPHRPHCSFVSSAEFSTKVTCVIYLDKEHGKVGASHGQRLNWRADVKVSK